MSGFGAPHAFLLARVLFYSDAQTCATGGYNEGMATEPPKPKRRWLRYSLRTFVVVPMRKRLLLSLAAAPLVGLVIWAILLISQHTGSQIKRENFDRIQYGMTEAEVEEILGGPSGTVADWVCTTTECGRKKKSRLASSGKPSDFGREVRALDVSELADA